MDRQKFSTSRPEPGKVLAANQQAMSRSAKLMSLTIAVFILAGTAGAYAYVRGAWLYRGFAPPAALGSVPVPGHPGRRVQVGSSTLRSFAVTSAALGGATVTSLVLLPPGYAASSTTRYPVLYLLHGTPGQPMNFVNVGQVGVWLSELIARGQIQPMIIVLPAGGLATFSNNEWANGVGPAAAWDTYLARDVVNAVDASFRTIPQGWGRAIGGLSEGGYGAINIALHHPGEFGTVQSWSGYEQAPNISVFGGDPQRLAANSPLTELPAVAPTLVRDRTFFWFYTSTLDESRAQNIAFAHALTKARVEHKFFIVPGSHNWATWRPRVPAALIAASKHLTRRSLAVRPETSRHHKKGPHRVH